MDRARERLLSDAYGWLELVVGVIAVTLPVVLPLTDWLVDDQDLRGSISSYYYGRPKTWFVGTLFALGVFFLSYEFPPRRGFRTDFVASIVASIAVVGVAMFPTSSRGEGATGGEAVVAAVHVGCAAVTFLLLAFFCLRFTRALTDLDESPADTLRRGLRPPTDGPLPSDRAFNTIFAVAAVVIVGCLVGIAAVNLLDVDGNWVFWLETVMVEAFGISWLVRSWRRRLVRRQLDPLVEDQPRRRP